MPVLSIESLSVAYAAAAGEQYAVRDLNLTVAPGECLGVVGESGAGKSQAFLAVMGLEPAAARLSGRIRLEGVEVSGSSRARLQHLRGARMAMIFQDHSTSLTPHLTVGDQIAEAILEHRGGSRRDAREKALELLERVQMREPTRCLRQYPHELSGGMRQRVMIAIALSCSPGLLIADEPTTALDVTVQAQILALLAQLKRERQLSIVLITHDLGVVAGLADRVAVMQGGRKVEEGDVAQIFAAPEHFHTRALLAAARGAAIGAAGTVSADTALDVQDLSVEFPLRRAENGAAPSARHLARVLRAVDGVSFELRAGEALGIVGESGCGKSTLVRAVLRLLPCSGGTVVWAGRSIDAVDRRAMRALRREMQIVFQDPLGSLDPHLSAGEIVAEPLAIHRPELSASECARAAAAMLARVGLAPGTYQLLPHELSGGQCQRVGIARAMILDPQLLVCDEPVSALDASLRDQIVQLIAALRSERGTSILFVSHDIGVVRRLCDRVLVLYRGRMMELASAEALNAQPLHPYTRALLSAVPVPDPAIQPERLRRIGVGGAESSGVPQHAPIEAHPFAGEPGCLYRARCPMAVALCAAERPAWEEAGPERRVACHRWRDADLS
ncbi:MAG TPA: ABC transporter ATP-binding protein [Steroidobacteraceae bacterium]|nr:ABC transporter ATP-binding protein [Steroidobacteraceae bacterium]